MLFFHSNARSQGLSSFRPLERERDGKKGDPGNEVDDKLQFLSKKTSIASTSDFTILLSLSE